MRGKCRIWWPKQQNSNKKLDSVILLGWFFRSSSTSLDVVVSLVASPEKISHSHAQLEEILRSTNAKMPLFLQDKSTFTILGLCAVDYSVNGSQQVVGDQCSKKISPQRNGDLLVDKCAEWSCGCHKLNSFIEQYRKSSVRNGNWVQLSYDTDFCHDGICGIPKLHHLHWDGLVVPTLDVHVIIYDRPIFGVHHYSLNAWSSSAQVKMRLKTPIWVNGIHQKQPSTGLDSVVCAVNSSTAAKVIFEDYVSLQNSFDQYPTVSMLVNIAWHLTAGVLASFVTLLYIILQLCHRFQSYGSQLYVYSVLAKVFSHTWRNIHIRSCQLLYWPIFLRDGGLRYHSSAEYAHKAALRNHSMWSSVAVDVFIGNIVGLTLLQNTESLCLWVLNFVHEITNNLMRSGCVWLMGVPAGFKLNTELAGIFGMIALNVIQIWSTIWFFLHVFFRYFIQGLALSGMILGVTVPAALVIDMIMLATLHVSTLQQLISLLYSGQIQALAALWRLFRGRKWNPLRERFDSYNYTVKQHVVGSLLFTPLLLLLPTTSVFHIFFTILTTTTSLVCVMIELSISILHATPYAKIFLWMVRRRLFPSGIWFDVVSGEGSKMLGSSRIGFISKRVSQSKKIEMENRRRHGVVASILRSNISSIGQIILPYYRDMFRGVSISSGARSAYGVLTGKRIPTALHTSLPSTMPWLSISFRDYWWLCYDSLLSCRSNNICKRKF